MLHDQWNARWTHGDRTVARQVVNGDLRLDLDEKGIYSFRILVLANSDNLFWKVRDRVIGKRMQRF